MAEYQHITNYDGVLRYVDNATVPPDPANRDWQTYLQYVADGGTTDPAPAPPEPPPPAPFELAADPVADMDAATKGYVDAEVAAVTSRVDTIERRLVAAKG
jgi:hypothetical protein